MNNKGRLFVVSAPSGCGKDTIVSKYLSRNEGIFKSISATTREKRGAEVDGVDYYFLTTDKFKQLIKDGGLLEYTEYCGNFYGTPLEPIKKHLESGENVILVIDVQGATQIKMKYKEAVTVFVMPPSIDELRRRITSRGRESADVVEIRLKAAESEMAKSKDYDYVIVNADIDKAVEDFSNIIKG